MNEIDGLIDRLKVRYSRENGILDIIHLIELLRVENIQRISDHQYDCFGIDCPKKEL